MTTQNVLLVDDNEDLRSIGKEFLTEEGHTVTLAKDGNEALSILEKEHFDIVVTDYSMPLGNGIQLIDEIIKRKINIRKVIVSSSIIDFDIQLLSKPYNQKDLLSLIEGCTGSK